MGSYDRFETGFFSGLYDMNPHGTNYTVAFLSRKYEVSQEEVRDLLIEWWKNRLIRLKNSGIGWEEWNQKQPNDDFFCYPPENPQFWVELTSRGEDRAARLHKKPIGFGSPSV
jgi:hypothetical protein